MITRLLAFAFAFAISPALADPIPIFSGSGQVANTATNRGALNLQPGAAAANLGFTPEAIFNVDKDYHAVGDGVSDDYTAFANALAACGTAGGGRVVFGPKRYYIGTTPIVPANCSLEGEAPALSYGANNPSFFVTQPYELLLGTGVTLQLGSGSTPDQGSALKNMAIVRAGMGQGATNFQSAIALVAGFSGTAVTIPHTSQGSKLENLAIAGFNLAIDSETDQARIHSVHGDNTNGLLMNNATDLNFTDDVSWNSILSAVPTQFQYLPITGVANDGSGHVQITVSTTTADIANGNTIYLGMLTSRQDIAGPWTVSNLSVSSTSTTFTLAGSSFAGPTVTGTVTSGSNYLKGIAPLVQMGFLVGQTVNDSASANCIPTGATISWINVDTAEAYLSAPATCSSANDSVVVTPATYVSGGIATLNAGYRSGYGFKVTNSQGVLFSNVFDWGHAIAFDVSTGSTWAQFDNFQCDGDAYTQVSYRICINIESTASMAVFSNGTILDDGIAIEINTSGTVSGASFSDIFNNLTVYNNNYLGTELLSGGAMFGSGVNFRSTYPNFVGDNATVQNLAHNTQTANPQTIYQSAADTANVSFPMVGNFSATGNISAGGTIGTGGNAPPASGMEIVGAASTFGYRVDDGAPASQNYSVIEPTFWRFNRGSGSSVGLEIETTNSGSWGSSSSAGSIWLNPNGGASNGLACFTDGRCNMELGISSFPGATFEIGGTLRLSGGTPTIASNACGSATQGTITAGGTDETGQVNVGTSSVTSCTVSFSATLPTAPRACQLTPANSAAAAWTTTGAYVSAITSSHFVISGANLSGTSYDYTCV
jgi:hypothetical protein